MFQVWIALLLCSSKEVCTKMWQWNLSNKCDSSCKACFGAQQFHCSSCHDGFYLNESNYCIDCDSSCATCSGTATTSCRPSFYLFKNQCYASCSVLGEGFVNNDENSTCVCGNGFVLNVSVCDPIPTGCDDHRCSVEDNSERHRVCQLHVPSSRSERVPQREKWRSCSSHQRWIHSWKH